MKNRLAILIVLGLLAAALAACGGGGSVTPGFDHMTARVVGNDGAPLANASVRVEGHDTGVKTDANGNFTLPASVFPRGASESQEITFGMNGVILGREMIVPGENPDEIKLGEGTGTATVTGTVYDENTSLPLSDVQITLFSLDNGVYQTVSAGGIYSVANVEAGSWQIAAFKEGYSPEMAFINVEDGATVTQDLALAPDGVVPPGEGLKVKGVLKDAKTGTGIAGAAISLMADTGYMGIPEMDVYNGYKDAVDGTTNSGTGSAEPGAPPSDANSSPVASMPFRYDPQYQETTTGADGSFEFENEVVGYTIWMNYSAEGYLGGTHYEDISGRTGTLELELTLDPIVPTDITGIITDENGDPVKDAYVEYIFAANGGMPMPLGMDVPVGMDLAGMAESGGATRSDVGAPPPPPTMGMPSGTDGNGWDEFASSPMAGGEAPADSNGGADNMLMQRYRYEHMNDRSGSEVTYFSGYYSTTTAEDGSYSFEGVPAGTYYVFASAYKHLPYNGEFEAKENAAENDAPITLPNVPVGSVEGTVVDENGEPVPDTLVNCTQPYVDPFTYTDATGHYRIDNVPTGSWIISGYKSGYLTMSKDTEITEDTVVTVNLTLSIYTPPEVELANITGRLADGGDNAGIEGADLVFTPVDETLGSYYRHIQSGTDGAYATTLIPGGEYNLLIQKTGFQDLYIRIYVDTSWPMFDYMLWKIGATGGGWGGTTRPPMPTEPGQTPPDGGNGGMPTDPPMGM